MRADYYTAASDPSTQLGLRLWNFDTSLGEYKLYERTDIYSYQADANLATSAPTTFDAPSGCRSSDDFIVPPQPAGHEVGADVVVSPSGTLAWGRAAPRNVLPSAARNETSGNETSRPMRHLYSYDS